MTRGTLTREQIVKAAIDLLDAEGLEGLNMRALGKRLGSAATAVYWHVGSKGSLIALAGDQVWNEIALPDLTAIHWRTAATHMATDLHAMLTRHPWLVQAFGSFLLYGPGKARHDDHLLAICEAAGLTGARADQATATVFTFVLGNALGPAAAASLTRKLSRDGSNAEELMRESMAKATEIATQFPRLRARLETVAADYSAAPEHSFEFGLQAILDGLEAQLIARRTPADQNARNHHDAAAEAAMAELLDLDGEVLHCYLSEVTGWVHELAAELSPRRILDLGCGTGTGALALARRFTQAEVIAVDVSAELLGRLADKARAPGVAGRIRAVRANLDAGWPDVGLVDLVWASASLHHLADPGRVLADVFAVLSPGGLLAVAEMDSFPRFLPDDPRPDSGPGSPAGLEARCHAAMAAGRAAELPHFGADWGPRLSRAGFTIEAERHFAIELRPPLPAATGRYAQASLRRMRSGLGDRMSAGDLAALGTLIDSDGPGGILQRADLTVRAARTIWVARRP